MMNFLRRLSRAAALITVSLLGAAACARAPAAAPEAPAPGDTVRAPLPRPYDPSVDPPPIEVRDPAALREAALLPRRRIVAFYGNPRSTRMGILGELPPDRMLARLDREVDAWRRADPGTPVQPALHLIAVMASASPGESGTYRVRMPARVIEQVLGWAERRDAIVFLDIQPGLSTVRQELPHLLPYLRRPNVHLALDPEWSMRSGQVPGKVIGSMDASQIQYAIDTLARLVDGLGLPPKVLVVHRFTQGMVTNLSRLRLNPRVQLVLNMDGWGPPSTKIRSYRDFVARAPVPFKGFKLFYRNDRRGGSRMMTPEEVLRLDPAPIYIQYQ